MATREDTLFEDALSKLRLVTQVSGNLRNDLKKSILEAIKDLTVAFSSLKEDLQKEKENNLKKNNNLPLASYSDKVRTQTATLNSNPPSKKIYKAVVSPSNPSIDTVKSIKDKINPVAMGIGINKVKNISNNSVIIECDSLTDINKICQEINKDSDKTIKASIVSKYDPRVIIFNCPDELDKNNALDIIKNQNSELFREDSKAIIKYVGHTKRKHTKFLVLEIDPATRKKLITNKIKMSWNVGHCADYVNIPRCFKCSKFHNYRDCTDKITCPLCAGEHALKDCKAEAKDHKCINCMSHNRHTKSANKLNIDHTALDKQCPTFKQLLNRRKENINYE